MTIVAYRISIFGIPRLISHIAHSKNINRSYHVLFLFFLATSFSDTYSDIRIFEASIACDIVFLYTKTIAKAIVKCAFCPFSPYVDIFSVQDANLISIYPCRKLPYPDTYKPKRAPQSTTEPNQANTIASTINSKIKGEDVPIFEPLAADNSPIHLFKSVCICMAITTSILILRKRRTECRAGILPA